MPTRQSNGAAPCAVDPLFSPDEAQLAADEADSATYILTCCAPR